jgi:hypothetical protein
LGHG